ncbi:MAG: hypothetical protein RL094_167 [Candidatus Parcubacteria bacterium]|jgi:hypothetical protein
MKKIKTISKAIVGTFCVYVLGMLMTTSPVDAVMRANFPDANQLQPLPQSIAPSPKGNINATHKVAPDVQKNPAPVEEATTSPIQKAEGFSLPWLISTLSVVLLVIALTLVLKKK